MTEVFIGIDPGASGAIAVVYPGNNKQVAIMRMPKNIEDIHVALRAVSKMALRVHWAMEQLPPCVGMGGEGTATGAQMGVLHRNAGRVEGIIWGMGHEPRMYAPQSWQRPLRDELPIKKHLSEERRQQQWKHALLKCAEARFPGVKIPLYAADAILIANHHLRQLRHQ